MIRSFKDKETELVFRGFFPRNCQVLFKKTALRKLIMLDASESLNDLRIPPSNHLERLSGDLKDKWSIRINDQFRIIFKIGNSDSDYYDVEIVDYH